MQQEDTLGERVDWYRVPVSKEDMSRLNRRSDAKGLAQTLAFLGLLACTGSVAFYSAYHWAWWITVLITFAHGTFWAFILNGFHELCHGTVFKTKALNTFFLRVFSFLGQHYYVHFQESHRRHHTYTLHPPGDLEVVLPINWKLGDLLLSLFFDYRGIYYLPRGLILTSLGKINGEWSESLLPATGPSRRQEHINWARIMLVGHALILIGSAWSGYWMLAVLTTLAPLYGVWLRFLCNDTQHVGLQDDVNDFRLCCRTIYLNPFLRFLYWHMNYHIEHHMYAGIPCYNLGALHRLIKPQLPPTPNGLVAAWTQIIDILKKQKKDPGYQYAPPIPSQA